VDARKEKVRFYVGLGNPGKKYQMTRHNMGYLVIETLAHLHQIPMADDKRFLAIVGKGIINGVQVHLVLPTTYMNESGQAVRRYMDYYKIPIEDLVVATDDADIPFGEIRIRTQGSTGGHNGLKSVQAHLGTTDYARIRLGIGREGERGTLADFVLDMFNKSETDQLASILNRGAEALEMLLTEEIVNVMNKVNKK
jgi:PTH1 family peptidyl-tRNA hydrolase